MRKEARVISPRVDFLNMYSPNPLCFYRGPDPRSRTRALDMGSPYNLLAWSRLLVTLALATNATAHSYSSTANTRLYWYWPESCDEDSSECDRFVIGGSCPITDSAENSWKDRMNRISLGDNDTLVGANEADGGACARSGVLRSGARSQKLMISDPATTPTSALCPSADSDNAGAPL